MDWENKTVAQIARAWYERLQKPLIVTFVLLAFGAGVFDLALAKNSALLAASLLLIQMVFDISDGVSSTKVCRRFRRVHDAAVHFRNRVERGAGSGKIVNIKWFGMSMEYGSPLLDDMISSLKKARRRIQVQLTIVMIDPEWEPLGDINPSWPLKAQANLENIKFLIDSATREFPEHNVEIDLYLYNHMPNWHGFVVDDRYGYISSCSWHDGRLLGGENPYELIDAQEDEVSAIKLQEFLSWFEYCQQTPVRELR